MVYCYKKIAAFYSEIRFDPNISNLGDLAIAIPHATRWLILIMYYIIHFSNFSGEPKSKFS
jgi:hypothetical protein